MQAVGGAEENAELGRDHRVVLEEIHERGATTFAGVGALGRHGELVLVAQQDQVVSRAGHGRDIGERDLARLVDEKVVELVYPLRPREQPWGAGDDSLLVGIEGVLGLNLFHIGQRIECPIFQRCRVNRSAQVSARLMNAGE